MPVFTPIIYLYVAMSEPSSGGLLLVIVPAAIAGVIVIAIVIIAVMIIVMCALSIRKESIDLPDGQLPVSVRGPSVMHVRSCLVKRGRDNIRVHCV